MDDLTQQLQSILADPQAMNQIQGMLRTLGGGEQSAPPPAQTGLPDLTALTGLLGGNQNTGQTGGQSGGSGVNTQTLALVGKLAPLLSQVNREDDATRLLRALRPLLGEARQKKVDEAIQILQMLRLLPLLKENGVFSGLLSGLM